MYETISIAEPIKKIVLECPFLMEFGITLAPWTNVTGYERFAQEESIPDQSFIDMGIADIQGQENMIDGSNLNIFRRIVTFFFIQDKMPDDPSVLLFRTNFVEWFAWIVDVGEYNGNPMPSFSYQRNLDGSISPFKWELEKLWAANALSLGQNANLKSMYSMDIHVSYRINYETGRCY